MKKYVYPALTALLLFHQSSWAIDGSGYANQALFDEAVSGCTSWAYEDGVVTEDLEAYLESCVPAEYEYLESTNDEDSTDSSTTDVE